MVVSSPEAARRSRSRRISRRPQDKEFRGICMAEETIVFARKASGLVREMSWWDVLLFTIAGPAAGGMTYYAVKMPGLYPGANMVWAFIIGFFVWLPPVLVIAAFASSFPRSGALYVVTSRVLHPMFGFIPNWIYVIGGGCGMAAGFIFYQGFIPIAGTLQLGGEMTGSESMATWADRLADPENKFWVVIVFMFIVWALELMGLDKLKWVMRVIIYTPIVGTILAFIFLFAVDGQIAFDDIYGAGAAAAVIGGRRRGRRRGRRDERLGRHDRRPALGPLGLQRPRGHLVRRLRGQDPAHELPARPHRRRRRRGHHLHDERLGVGLLVRQRVHPRLRLPVLHGRHDLRGPRRRRWARRRRSRRCRCTPASTAATRRWPSSWASATSSGSPTRAS